MHSPAHCRAFGGRGRGNSAVKIFEREVKGRSVGGGGGTFILDGRARVAVKPFARALGVRVECRGAEMLLPPRNATGFFGFNGLGQLKLYSSVVLSGATEGASSKG